MKIMTKKEIEEIEYLEINKCKLVAYKDFIALKEILEKIIEAADVCLKTGFEDMLDELLAEYEGEG
jgi:hypothetical protein